MIIKSAFSFFTREQILQKEEPLYFSAGRESGDGFL
jgi:hypothetical protein